MTRHRELQLVYNREDFADTRDLSAAVSRQEIKSFSADYRLGRLQAAAKTRVRRTLAYRQAAMSAAAPPPPAAGPSRSHKGALSGIHD